MMIQMEENGMEVDWSELDQEDTGTNEFPLCDSRTSLISLELV